jgi:hypothetical protein
MKETSRRPVAFACVYGSVSNAPIVSNPRFLSTAPLRAGFRFVLLTISALALAAADSTLAAPRREAVRRPVGMAEVNRIFVIILENEDGTLAEQQPFLAHLTAQGAYLKNYHALTHPSQPNYVALTAGSAYGITDDLPFNIAVPHIGNLIEDKGLDWKVYAEQYPGNCFLGLWAGPPPGQYVRKHLPFLNYADVQQNPKRCARIVNSNELDADIAADRLPQFAMYIPNTWNDGHDSSVAVADLWLQNRFGYLFTDPIFMRGTLVVILFDEGTDNGPNVVFCTLLGAGVRVGARSQNYYDHYDLLRTFEAILGTSTLHHHDETAHVINDIWK